MTWNPACPGPKALYVCELDIINSTDQEMVLIMPKNESMQQDLRE